MGIFSPCFCIRLKHQTEPGIWSNITNTHRNSLQQPRKLHRSTLFMIWFYLFVEVYWMNETPSHSVRLFVELAWFIFCSLITWILRWKEMTFRKKPFSFFACLFFRESWETIYISPSFVNIAKLCSNITYYTLLFSSIVFSLDLSLLSSLIS